jgi:hypothetical protein
MNIKVTIKSAYGRELVYPACDKSRLLAKLASTKTFTHQHLVYITALGYSVEVYTQLGEFLQTIELRRNLQ